MTEGRTWEFLEVGTWELFPCQPEFPMITRGFVAADHFGECRVAAVFVLAAGEGAQVLAAGERPAAVLLRDVEVGHITGAKDLRVARAERGLVTE